MNTKMVWFKNVDIQKQVISIVCSWTKRLYNDSFHEWKIILLHLISKTFGKFAIFHSNLLSFKNNLIKSFSSFNKEFLLNWETFFSKTPKHLPVLCLSFYGIISTSKWMKAMCISLGFHKIIWTSFLSFLTQTVQLKPSTF